MRENPSLHAAPPAAGWPATGRPGHFRLLTRTVLAALLAGALASAAWATVDRSRDPAGDPAAPGTEVMPVGWNVVVVPGLARGTTLGELWVAPTGEVHVWATVPNRTVRTLDGDDPGEIQPPDRGTLPTFSSVLLRYASGVWTPVLNVAQSSPGAVYGTSATDLYATTTQRNGRVSVWRYDGIAWTREPLPVELTGVDHSITGITDDVWLRVGPRILFRTGGAWSLTHELPPGAGGGGLAYLPGRTVIAPSACGHCLMQNDVWYSVPEDFTFSCVHDAWGTRSASGALALYAVGCNDEENGLRAWQFTEGVCGSLVGCWGGRNATAISDPPGEGTPGVGEAHHVWGAAANDVFVGGALEGRGIIYHFDGSLWTKQPVTDIPEVMGVSGTGHGETWFSLADGRLLRYARRNALPDVSGARVSPATLWPPSHRLTPVSIVGVTDTDGDTVRVTVTAITQDEPVLRRGDGHTCPDAVIRGGQARVRAERSALGNGRVYAITFTADDGAGGVVTGHASVCVPHMPGGTCVDDGQQYVSTGPCPCRPGDGLSALRVVPMPAGGARVQFSLDEAAEVTLDVHDVAGRLVSRLAAGTLDAGEHEVTWNDGACRPGVYFLRLRNGAAVQTKTVVLNR